MTLKILTECACGKSYLNEDEVRGWKKGRLIVCSCCQKLKRTKCISKK